MGEGGRRRERNGCRASMLPFRILITASSNHSFVLPSQPPWEGYITNYQSTGERTKPGNSCDLLVVSHDQNPIPFKSNPVFPIDSQFGVNPLTSCRLCSGTVAFTASVCKVRERPWDDYRAESKAELSKR